MGTNGYLFLKAVAGFPLTIEEASALGGEFVGYVGDKLAEMVGFVQDTVNQIAVDTTTTGVSILNMDKTIQNRRAELKFFTSHGADPNGDWATEWLIHNRGIPPEAGDAIVGLVSLYIEFASVAATSPLRYRFEIIPERMLARTLAVELAQNSSRSLTRWANNAIVKASKGASHVELAPNSARHYTDFADEAAEIMENAARSRGLNPNAGVRAMAAPIRDVDISKLVPPPTRSFADPGKLQRLGPFDWSKYRPIQVEDLGGGRYMIMDGMTRLEAARRAGITKLPVQIFPKSGS